MVDSAESRPGGPEDAIDGVVPERVAQPATAAALAAVLAQATADRRTTVVRGGGTKLSWGRVPQAVGQILSTSRLQTPLVHRAGDLTATVGAGVRLADLNALLGMNGQCLPVESASSDATIGGMIATNESGPMRHRHGTPRDLVLGVTLALPDGRIAKAGGTVVKNVAGYDFGRFLSGSLGQLAVIVDATFKLVPLPRASSTLRLACGSPAHVADAWTALSASQLEAAAVDLQITATTTGAVRREFLVRFATSPAATTVQAEQCRLLLPGAVLVTGTDEEQVWEAQVTQPWAAGATTGATVRCSWAPSALADVVALIEACRVDVPDLSFVGRVGVGAGLLRCGGTAAGQARAVARLRSSGIARHVVLLRGDRELKERVDVWGPPVPWSQPLAALKQTLDPAGILGAGRGPL